MEIDEIENYLNSKWVIVYSHGICIMHYPSLEMLELLMKLEIDYERDFLTNANSYGHFHVDNKRSKNDGAHAFFIVSL